MIALDLAAVDAKLTEAQAFIGEALASPDWMSARDIDAVTQAGVALAAACSAIRGASPDVSALLAHAVEKLVRAGYDRAASELKGDPTPDRVRDALRQVLEEPCDTMDEDAADALFPLLRAMRGGASSRSTTSSMRDDQPYAHLDRLASAPPLPRRVLTPYQEKLAAAGHCMSNSDGDCGWKGCPQLRDGEPGATGRHCPRDLESRRRLDPDDEGKAGNG